LQSIFSSQWTFSSAYRESKLIGSEIKRVCVVGAGAIGSLFVGHIGALSGIEITVLTRREEHARDLNEKGLKVSGKSDLHADVTASTDPARLGKIDLLISATKTTAVETSARRLSGHFPGAVVMMVQNGLGCENLIREQGDWPIISGLTFMSGVRLSDTHVEYELDTPTWIGPWDKEVDRPGYPFIKQVEALIRRSGLNAEAYEDLRPVQWSKLIFNSVVNAVSAVTNLPHVPSFARRDRLEDLGHLVHDMMAEGVAIANAKGIELSSDPWAMNCQAVSQGDSHGGEEYAHITSMLNDVRNRNDTEVDWITGSIVRAAKETGIPAPYHETLYRLIKGVESSWHQR
jgi:2-dehydropantoate 2-reductase